MEKQNWKSILRPIGIIAALDLLCAIWFGAMVSNDPSIAIVILFFWAGIAITSLILAIVAFCVKRNKWGALLLVNVIAGPLLMGGAATVFDKIQYKLQHEEYVFEDENGSHVVSITNKSMDCELFDCEFYPGTHNIQMSCNYKEGTAERVNRHRFILYLESGDTLTISNDTLYGYSAKPILLKDR